MMAGSIRYPTTQAPRWNTEAAPATVNGMPSEIRTCQSCKSAFAIAPEDFDFYKKIDVPPPTWCPECRMRRRYAWRNDRNLYRRTCDLCQKSIVTMYSPNKP